MTSSEPQIDTQSEIMFFLGAGASVPAGLSDVINAVPKFQEWLSKKESECKGCSHAANEITMIMSQRNSINANGKAVDIETMLEIVEMLEASFTDILADFFKDKTLKLDETSVELLKSREMSNELKTFIQITFQDFKTSKYYEPLKRFVANYNPLPVFTTNYDLVVEHYCNSESPRIKYTDFLNGYEWNAELPNTKEFGVMLYKLHGSVNWARTESGKYVKLTQKNRSGRIELIDGEQAVPLILYPGKKLEYIEPTLELLQLLKKSLMKVNCCFAVGYKFGDEHISKLFRYSASRNEHLRVFLISPSAHSIYFNKLKRHTDDEFGHSFLHEDFTDGSFNTTVSTDLEGRVICLPYKFESIFPMLLDYYEQLKGGLAYDTVLSGFSGILEPLTRYGSCRLIDCLYCYNKCEYYDRIDTIIEERAGGWDSVISKVAQVDHARYDLLKIYDIILKRYFNYFTSNQRQDALDLLQKYLVIKGTDIAIGAENYELKLKLKNCKYTN